MNELMQLVEALKANIETTESSCYPLWEKLLEIWKTLPLPAAVVYRDVPELQFDGYIVHSTGEIYDKNGDFSFADDELIPYMVATYRETLEETLEGSLHRLNNLRNLIEALGN